MPEGVDNRFVFISPTMIAENAILYIYVCTPLCLCYAFCAKIARTCTVISTARRKRKKEIKKPGIKIFGFVTDAWIRCRDLFLAQRFRRVRARCGDNINAEERRMATMATTATNNTPTHFYSMFSGFPRV